MRIIAGALKGRRLAPPDFEGLRPTSDKLRETLFNVIAGRVRGATVLDAFAGTGALGIEALSRSAAQVTFVDTDRRAVALVSENVRRCGVAERCVIIRGRLVEVSQHLAMAPFDLILLDPPYVGARGVGRPGSKGPRIKKRHDAESRPVLSPGLARSFRPRERAASWGQPPSHKASAARRSSKSEVGGPSDPFHDLLRAAAGVLTHDGLVVLEHARGLETPDSVGELARTRALVSGDSVLSFYERRSNLHGQ